MIDKGAADQEEKPLPHVSEHNAEDEGVCQSHENGRVHFIMCREPIHLDKHFKRLEDLRVFQLRGWLSEISVVVVLNDYEYLVVILDFFQEFLHIVLRHPSAEDIVVFLVIFHSGGEFAHVKVVGQLF